MKRTFPILASLLLLLPALSADGDVRAQSGDGQVGLAGSAPLPLGFDGMVGDRFGILERARRPQTAQQVRVEQRVVIRIAPSSNATRARLIAELPRRAIRSQFEETNHGDCVPIDALAGVQPMENNRLLLITRDRQLLTAGLDRSCSAQAFYAGFYIEGNEDGQLCVARDQLQSRAGDSCEVADLRRLVAVRN